MSLIVQDFGPITHADITFNKFTIIIGKNNLGKSYLTQLMQGIYEHLNYFGLMVNNNIYTIDANMREPFYISLDGWDSRARRRFKLYKMDIEDEIIVDIRKQLRNKRVSNKTILNTILIMFNKKIPNSLKDDMSNSLSSTYGMDLKELVSINKSKSIIRYQYNNYNTIYMEISNRGKMKFRYQPSKEQIQNLADDTMDIIDNARKLQRLTEKRIINFIIEIVKMLLSIPYTDLVYFPAGRAGLLEGYDTLVSIFIELASIAPRYGISMPRIHGIASQFYNLLFSLRGSKGPYNSTADKMIDIMGGNITIQRPRGLPKGSGRLYYTFKKQDKSKSIPVIQAASMIKELTPIYLVLKEVTRPNSVIMIEEPESHLHPSAQCDLAEVFTELSNHDLNIVITTHSDLLVRKIGNLIGAFKYEDEEVESKLNPKSLSLYLLKEGDDGSTTSIIPIPEDGIFENIPEFDEVINELYDRQLKYQRLEQKEV